MYFDPEPKTERRDLFNYEEEYGKLKAALKRGDRIIALKGVRRVGKTSLLNVVYGEVGGPKLFLDGRVIEPRINSIFMHLIKGMVSAISESFLDLKARSIVRSLGISILDMNVEFNMETGSSSIAEIDKVLRKKKAGMVVVIDEVQKLKPARIDGVIAHIYEHTKNIQFVLAGSEVGLMDEVLGEEAASDLYGRPKTVVRLCGMEGGKCREFLKKGFSQEKKSVPDSVLEEAVGNFDGIIGWHTLFGYYAMREGCGAAMKKVLKEGRKIVAAELDSFLSVRGQARRRYLEVLSVLKNPQHWSDIKNYLSVKERKQVNDRMVSKYISELEKHGFIVRREGEYFVADPMTSGAVILLTGGK